MQVIYWPVPQQSLQIASFFYGRCSSEDKHHTTIRYCLVTEQALHIPFQKADVDAQLWTQSLHLCVEKTGIQDTVSRCTLSIGLLFCFRARKRRRKSV